MTKLSTSSYPFVVFPLAEDEGGGYIAYFLNVPWLTCSGSGDTIADAMFVLDEVAVDVEAELRSSGMLDVPFTMADMSR